MTYSLHPGAEHDIAKALDFYSEHADSVVAEHFLEEFERIAKLLVEHQGTAQRPQVSSPTSLVLKHLMLA